MGAIFNRDRLWERFVIATPIAAISRSHKHGYPNPWERISIAIAIVDRASAASRPNKTIRSAQGQLVAQAPEQVCHREQHILVVAAHFASPRLVLKRIQRIVHPQAP